MVKLILRNTVLEERLRLNLDMVAAAVAEGDWCACRYIAVVLVLHLISR